MYNIIKRMSYDEGHMHYTSESIFDYEAVKQHVDDISTNT